MVAFQRVFIPARDKDGEVMVLDRTKEVEDEYIVLYPGHTLVSKNTYNWLAVHPVLKQYPQFLISKVA